MIISHVNLLVEKELTVAPFSHKLWEIQEAQREQILCLYLSSPRLSEYRKGNQRRKKVKGIPEGLVNSWSSPGSVKRYKLIYNSWIKGLCPDVNPTLKLTITPLQMKGAAINSNVLQMIHRKYSG